MTPQQVMDFPLDGTVPFKDNIYFQTLAKENRVEGNEEPSIKCDLCEYQPNKPSKKNIRVHKESVHFGIKYPCPHCGTYSTTKSNMLKHVRIYHIEIVPNNDKVCNVPPKDTSDSPNELKAKSKKLVSEKRQSKRKTGWYVGCDKEEDHCPCCKTRPWVLTLAG